MFQTQVYPTLAPGVAGDFASHNPRYMVDAGPGGLVSGAAGLTVGTFGWMQASFIDPDNTPTIVNNFGYGTPDGFIGRFWQGLNTTYLSSNSMFIPGGFMTTLFQGGDFWAVNSGSAQATIGMNAYADLATGKISFATGKSAAATVTAASSTIAASTFSVTGSVQGNVMTVTVVGSGTVVAGATISGTGVATGTQVVSQLSGTAGGVGTYALSIAEQTAASTTISGTYGTLTLGGTASGALPIGALITGSGISVTTYVRQLLTGSAGATSSTYSLDVNTAQASPTTFTFTTNVATNWIARSSGLTTEIVKIYNGPNN
jgi:hypothetical protein